MRRSSRRSFFAVAALVAAAAVFGLAFGGFAPTGVAALAEAAPDAAVQAETAPVDCCITRPASSCCRIGRRLASTPDLFPPPPASKPATTTTKTATSTTTTATAAASTAPAYDCCKADPVGSCCRLGRRLASVAEDGPAASSTSTSTEAPADCCATNPAGSCCRLGRRLASVPVPTTALNNAAAADSAVDCCKTNPAGSCCRLGK